MKIRIENPKTTQDVFDQISTIENNFWFLTVETEHTAVPNWVDIERHSYDTISVNPGVSFTHSKHNAYESVCRVFRLEIDPAHSAQLTQSAYDPNDRLHAGDVFRRAISIAHDRVVRRGFEQTGKDALAAVSNLQRTLESGLTDDCNLHEPILRAASTAMYACIELCIAFCMNKGNVGLLLHEVTPKPKRWVHITKW